MATVTLYIATSLDGYIARKDGRIDWLTPFEGGSEDYGYDNFYASIDAIVMGRKTYDQALSFGEWPYPGKPSYVLSRRGITSDRADVISHPGGPSDVIKTIESKGLRCIWLVGGAEVVAAFRQQALIDEYIISVVPLLLGDGIPLFAPALPEARLSLTRSKTYPNGLVQMHYFVSD